jgi:hypothetical protein
LKRYFGISLPEAAAIHGWEHAMPKYREYLFGEALSPKYPPNYVWIHQKFQVCQIRCQNHPHFSMDILQLWKKLFAKMFLGLQNLAV